METIKAKPISSGLSVNPLTRGSVCSANAFGSAGEFNWIGFASRAFVRSAFPPHFFPDAPPAMKALLWQSLTDQHSSVREAMAQLLSGSLQTSVAAEIADMMIDDYEKSWSDYRVVEALRTTRA